MVERIHKAMPAFLRSFAANRRSNTAVMFALSLAPILGGVGFAVDYSAGMRQRTLLQSAVDAAALAGEQAQSASAIAGLSGDATATAVQTAVENYIAASYRSPGSSPVVSVDSSVANVVTVNVSANVPNQFMRIVGRPTTEINAKAQASAGSGSNKLEVALVFDTTYSMTGAKLASAQSAAVSLINTLYATPSAANNIRIGLVPFSYYVNVGTSNAGASWLTNTSPVTGTIPQTGTTCAVGATYSSVLTQQTCSGTNTADGVSVPYSYDCSYYAQLTPAGQCTSSTYYNTYSWNGCVGSRFGSGYSPDLTDTVTSANPVPALIVNAAQTIAYGNCPNPLQRLTNSSSSLISQINALQANYETFIAPGLLWGWRVLSPNGPFSDGAAYNAGAKKVLVLMTDGANTHSPQPNYLDHDHEGSDVDATGANLTAPVATQDKLDANLITLQTCKAIQASGVTI